MVCFSLEENDLKFFSPIVFHVYCGGGRGECRRLQSACAAFLQKEDPDYFLSPPPSPPPQSTVYTGPLHIITSAYIIVFIHYTSLPGPPAILYSAYRPFDMFLLSSRYNLKFHAFLRGLMCTPILCILLQRLIL